MGLLSNAKQFMDRHIDYRAAIIGALLLGGIVFAINLNHGWPGATTAGMKQGIYTFFAGGYMVRLNERIALAFSSGWIAVPAGVLGAGGLAVTLTYLVHSLRGTPEPFNSTLPTIVLSCVGFSLLGIVARRRAGQQAGALTANSTHKH